MNLNVLIARDYFRYLREQDGRLVVEEDEEGLSNLYALSNLHDWVDDVINHRLESGLKSEQRARSILDAINSFELDERFRYSENIVLFFEIYLQFIASLKTRPRNEFALNLQNLIDVIRFAANKKFRNCVASRKRSAVNNQNSAHGLIDRLFETYDKLHVVRLDLLMEKGGEQPATVRDAQTRLKCFFGDRRREKIHQELVGYIWKLEYAPRKGVYFHVILFLHTEVPCKHSELVKRFGEYWKFVATGMKGDYICIDEKWAPLRFGGGGVILSDDEKMRKTLQRGLDYVIYKDVFLQPQLFVLEGRKKMRTFGKSN